MEDYEQGIPFARMKHQYRIKPVISHVDQLLTAAAGMQ